MSGNANSGRRPAPPVNVTTLEELSLAQALVMLRLKGRRMSRRKLMSEIAVGRLPAFVNWGRLSNKREPTYVLKRPDLDRWLRASLAPLNVQPLSA